MSELLYNKSKAVEELNKVEGFYPLELARVISNEGQEEQRYLDVKYRKLWFRLVNPTGKIISRIVHFTENMAVVEARIYLDKCDQEDNYIANSFSQKFRTADILKYLRPDGKSQVTVEYDEAGIPHRLDAVVLSTQHDPDVTQEQIHEDIKKYVLKPIIPTELVDKNTKFFINPTGRFVIGGPHGDSGVTGRKIIVDTYGGMACHGGGAFSGKDCTKVDRSAAYAARYVAKNIVAAGLAKKCEIQLSYAIGVAHPTSIMVDTFGTGKISDESLVEMIRKEFDLRPAGIIQMLDLRRPIYKQTAAYGHFGRNDLNLPWERLDKVEELKKYLK